MRILGPIVVVVLAAREFALAISLKRTTSTHPHSSVMMTNALIAQADDVEYTSMHQAEQWAFENVGSACHADVERWCRGQKFVWFPLTKKQEKQETTGEDQHTLSSLPKEAVWSANFVEKASRRLLRQTPLQSTKTTTTNMMMQSRRHGLFLPFTQELNTCLESAFEAGQVSTDCGSSLLTLRSVRSQLLNFTLHQHQLLNQISIFNMLFLLTLMVAMWKGRKALRHQRRLRRVILTTVYRHPALKRQLELVAGQSVGYAPPLPPHHLSISHKLLSPLWFRVPFLLAWMAVVWFFTEIALRILLVLAMLLFVLVVCSRSSTGDDDDEQLCTCCCCGVTTDDVKNGKTLTQAQACCNCCVGTGVCSLQCVSCCGDGAGDNNCSCVGAGCCCCSGKTSPGEKGGCCSQEDKPKVTKQTVLSFSTKDAAVYKGVPVQIV